MRYVVAALSLLIGLAQNASSPAIILVVGEGLNEPFAIDFDTRGHIFIVEHEGHRISMFDRNSGRLSRLAGTGTPGLAGDDGPAAEAQLNAPHHALVGPDGNLYVADTLNFCVRKIDLHNDSHVISRVAGTGQKGFSGDGGRALEAQFGGIYAIAFRDRLLYIDDLDNRRIRTVNLDTGIVSTVAGNGEKGVPQEGEPARTQPLLDPRAVAVDGKGNIYILERNGHVLRMVDTAGRIHTVAGSGEQGATRDDCAARDAKMNGPKSIVMDRDGESVLIADTENHVIRRYSPTDGRLTRVAGTFEKGNAGIGGPARECQLNRPHGVKRDPTTGALYIADSENHRVLSVDPR